MPALSRIQRQGNTTPPSQLAMFAPSLGRVARSTSSLSPAPVLTFCRAALSTGRPSHQRRYSSSKSSIPPSSRKKLEQNAATQLQGAETGVKAEDKAAEIPVATSMNDVPHVPPTTHLHVDGEHSRGRLAASQLTNSRRASFILLRAPSAAILPPRGMAATRNHGRVRCHLPPIRARRCAVDSKDPRHIS
jgi:hypothetical protein